MEEDCLVCSGAFAREYNLHNLHHTSQIEIYKLQAAD